MAGLLLQMGKEFTDVDIEVVPGVTAALSGAALLGAPLGHDFCVISLSDLLTPWDVIEKRLRCAAAGIFVLCLYNPASRKRADYLRRACNVLLSAGKKGGYGVRFGAQYWPGGRKGAPSDSGGAARNAGGYVHHGVYWGVIHHS